MARSSNMVIPELYLAESLRATKEIIDVFNAASSGCLQLDSEPARRAMLGGDYLKNVRIKQPSGLVSRNDTANPTNTASTVNIVQTSGSSVVQQCRIGPATYTRDEVMSGYKTPADYTVAVAELFASERLIRLRNNLIAALVAAVDSADTTDGSTASANIHVLDVVGKTPGSKVTATLSYLNSLLAKMGDARSDIELFVMPAAVFADLVGDSISNYKIENVAGTTIYQDVVQAFGRKVMVADVPALTSAQTSDYYTEYNILGLGVGAATAKIVSKTEAILKQYTTTEVLYDTVRQDFDVDYAIRGMKWAPTVATPNPTDAQMATAASWDEDYEDHRDLPLVKMVCNAS